MQLSATFFFALGYLTQVQYAQVQDCSIESITSPSASALKVKWKAYQGATNYFLDLRVVNATNITPVVLTVPWSATEKLVQGLRPGTVHSVTLKVFQFYYVTCIDSKTSLTVPATSQITVFKAISSTAIHLEWTGVKSAERYTVALESIGMDFRYNFTFFNLSGNVTGLQPSTSYYCSVYAWNAAGWGAASLVKTVTTLAQPPDSIRVQAIGTNTVQVSWQKVNKVLFYQVTLTSVDDQTSTLFIASTSATNQNITSLLPCSTYKIGVSSLSPFLEPGEPSYAVYSMPVINAVTSILVDYACASATVTWGLVDGASSYRATASAPDGTDLSCTSPSGTCEITGLRCGTRYRVQVTAIMGSCKSSPSTSTYFETVTCPPSNLGTFRECSSNVIIFSWAPSNNTLYYVATSKDSTGLVTECRTSETSCFFTNAACGRTYAFDVYAVSSRCNSGRSNPAYVQTAPCEPKNVRTVTECQPDTLTLAWSASLGALSYMVEAQDNSGNYYNCSSMGTNCSMVGLACGQSLSVWITASNDECSSSNMLGQVMESAPCPARNVSAVSDCSSNTVTMTWDDADGALLYFALVVHADGSVNSCRSVSTSCQIQGLRCGGMYTAFLVTSNLKCNSSASTNVTLHTAPCPPVHVEGWVECFNNTAFFSWDHSSSVVSYLARAVGTDGHTLSCNSSSPGCQMSGLHCSQTYTFTVSATGGSCQSPESAPFQLDAAPCTPVNVQRHLHCATNTLTVRWDPESRPLNYSATVRATGGSARLCSSQNTSCSVGPLSCGQMYAVTVTASTNTCSSAASVANSVQTAPCVPQNFQGQFICASNTLMISWDEALGAKAYISTVQSQGGYRDSCSTANLSCFFSHLKCAQQYTISVVAIDDHCNSTGSPALSLTSVPCSPKNITTRSLCDNDVVEVSWNASLGARSYTVLAEVSGWPSSICRSGGTSCQLDGLACGQMYNITVFADDGTCNSTSPSSATIATAPCPPVIVNSTLDCSTNKVTLSWVTGAGALNVVVNATSTLGNRTWCQSTNGTCDLADLQCGQTYVVQAVAVGERCSSTASLDHKIMTVPCAPAAVTSLYNCTTNAVMVSWKNNPGGGSVMAQIESDRHGGSCVTTGNACNIHGLWCGKTYNASAHALASHCNSSRSYGQSVETEPCSVENASASLVCHNNTALVEWTAAAGAVVYEVNARGWDGDIAHCQSPETTCTLPQLRCGKTYNISITPNSKTCRGGQNWIHNYTAGPCPPYNVTVALTCDNSSGWVSWTPVPAAEVYLATMTARDGDVRTCYSNTTSCSFASLHCGQYYTVTVVTFERGCQSEPSHGVVLRTAICPPGNLKGVMSCDPNSILITWDKSPGEEVTYFLFSQVQGGLNGTYTTANTSYLLTDLPCGEDYIFFVSAKDTECNSTLSAPLKMTTAPCPPTNLTVWVECAISKGTLSWTPGKSRQSYTAKVVGTHGHMTSCTSNDTSCFVELDCGHKYSATVASSMDYCNSTMSESIEFNSAPCLPKHVVAQLDCGANTLAVQWDQTRGSVSYTALAIGTDGSRASCNTSSSTCTISRLSCGQVYEIAVTASSVNCSIIMGSDYRIQSAPCKAQDPVVNLNCDNNMATVSWNSSGVVQAYIAMAVGLTGEAATCSSTGSSCTFSNLSCGDMYNFTVAGVMNNCSSEVSSVLNVITVPCAPGNITVRPGGQAGTATVSWLRSSGATAYTVTATAASSHSITCHSNDTVCLLGGLACDEEYTVEVLAHGATCSRKARMAGRLVSAPCPPTATQVWRLPMEDGKQLLRVSWAVVNSSGVEYLLEATGSIQGNERTLYNVSSYWTNWNYFEIVLPCSSSYAMQLRSRNAVGTSGPSEATSGMTAPCPPLAITYQIINGSAFLSWNASVFATEYSVYELRGADKGEVCRTTELHCVLAGVNHSAIEVLAISTAGQSNPTTVILDGMTYRTRRDVHEAEMLSDVPETGLSIPAVQLTEVTASTLQVQWSPAEGATHYSMMVREASSSQDPGPLVLSVYGEKATVSNLKPATRYCISVAAQSSANSSSYSRAECTTTRAVM